MTKEERTKLIRHLKYNRSIGADYLITDEDVDEIIKALEQTDVLDKIRAEIEQITSRYSISRERGGMGQVEWSDRLIKESEVMQILDKYKVESEE